MSCDFYFKKWITTLQQIKIVVQVDLEYQDEMAHDQLFHDAVLRLASVLGQYMVIYKNVIECIRHNLQIQKTIFMDNILKAIISRILELKRELLKLEKSQYHFFSTALATSLRTTYDADMAILPFTPIRRTSHTNEVITKIFDNLKQKKRLSEIDGLNRKREVHSLFLQSTSNSEDSNLSEDLKLINRDEVSEESLRRRFVAIIIAHEKLRQTTKTIKLTKQRREAWMKELNGTAHPTAKYEIREKSAQFIQKAVRTYFEMKRKRIQECKLTIKLGMNFCTLSTTEKVITIPKKLQDRSELHDYYVKKFLEESESLKERYIKRYGDGIVEDFRDRMREWFHEWFQSIQFIHDIPKPGAIDILRDEVPSPHEWLEEYKESMIRKKEGKGKSALQLKYEADRLKREEQRTQKEKHMKQKLEAAMNRKLMKQPNLHPGYYYPQSKRIKYLLEVIEQYHGVWDCYDAQESLEAKCKYVEELAKDEACMNAKLEMLGYVNKDMGVEMRKLKQALRRDYENNGEVMPKEQKMRKRHKKKKLKMVKTIPSKRFEDKFEALAFQGFIVDYPKTELEDYVGDTNFVGEDRRRLLLQACHQAYEIRNLWWEMCYSARHGFHSILLVGPDGSGKTKLVQTMANINDAVLFKLDPLTLTKTMCTPINLRLLCKDFLFCARVVQPSIIYIKHVEKLFLKKTTEETDHNLNFITWYFINSLFKNMNRQDKITVIGSCSDPWLTQYKPMLKRFTKTVLLPKNTYCSVVQMLKDWVIKYPVIPSTFNVSCLAQVLQGYSYGYLQNALTNFMSDERIVKIAAYGVTPLEVYNHIIDDKNGILCEYERYLKWYLHKTIIGKKEKKHLDDQIQFRNAVEEFERIKAKKIKAAKRSAATSAVTSSTALV